MHKSTLGLICCPKCHGALVLQASDASDASDEIETGLLLCGSCSAGYPIKGGIARFVPEENYAGNFGVQWNRFRATQLDSHSGTNISRDRFTSYTGWTEKDLTGTLVLDAGCGAGRFAEIALALGGKVIAIDFSNAVEAARENLKDKGDIDFLQADITALPFAPGTFPLAYCLGVIQHTPDPGVTFGKLSDVVAPGGRLALDVYAAGWKRIFYTRNWIRPIVSRMSPERSYRLVERLFPSFYAVSRGVGRIPVIGRYLRYMIPVANYTGVHPLNARQLREWALLDTFDMLAPAYDQPQTMETVRSWFRKAGFTAVEVFRSGFIVGRGTKPAEPR